jgi:hypothetical protein
MCYTILLWLICTWLCIVLAYMACTDIHVNTGHVQIVTFRMPQCLAYVTHFAFSSIIEQSDSPVTEFYWFWSSYLTQLINRILNSQYAGSYSILTVNESGIRHIPYKTLHYITLHYLLRYRHMKVNHGPRFQVLKHVYTMSCTGALWSACLWTLKWLIKLLKSDWHETSEIC